MRPPGTANHFRNSISRIRSLPGSDPRYFRAAEKLFQKGLENQGNIQIAKMLKTGHGWRTTIRPDLRRFDFLFLDLQGNLRDKS